MKSFSGRRLPGNFSSILEEWIALDSASIPINRLDLIADNANGEVCAGSSNGHPVHWLRQSTHRSSLRYAGLYPALARVCARLHSSCACSYSRNHSRCPEGQFQRWERGVSLVMVVGFSETLARLIQAWTRLESSIGAVARVKRSVCETEREESAGRAAHVSRTLRGGGIRTRSLFSRWSG